MSLLAALQFLTRVPIRLRREPSLEKSVAWFPVAGAVIGAAVGGVAAGLWFVVPPMVAAAILLAGFGWLVQRYVISHVSGDRAVGSDNDGHFAQLILTLGLSLAAGCTTTRRNGDASASTRFASTLSATPASRTRAPATNEEEQLPAEKVSEKPGAGVEERGGGSLGLKEGRV